MYEIIPKHKFLVGIDSDGCAFDTMELKHKECFIPPFIKHFGLQGVSKFARECAEFVNLYSKDRGCNRFHALIKQLALLGHRPEVKARGYDVKPPPGVVAWTERETKLGNPALETEVAKTGDADLKTALAWSKEVNVRVSDMVHHVPPFPLVRECLEAFAERADILVVSATPNEALHREWAEHGIDKHVAAICGQEIGSKKEVLGNAKKYAAGAVLMIGDAPGDYQAAVANKAWFFPINPGAEEASWKRLHEEGLARFLNGKFDEAYQKELLAEFDKRLPEKPSWPTA
ncbi:MAG: haloacid dehalogenase [Planctomycetota bacterium]|nr:MAG: haloacid dehalogenase [Planctomycetota bacterium]